MAQENEAYEPKIIAFLCNWCSYAGADLAGTSRTQYPPNIRVIRVMCSARVEPLFVLKALLEGADGVLLSGCHIGDCHYLKGNFAARRRYAVFVELMKYVGIDPERFQMSWVSASEGAKFGKVVADFVERVARLGPRKRLELSESLEKLIEGGGT
jgi:coenzyme F420-reducing hydrogenase delta subunit